MGGSIDWSQLSVVSIASVERCVETNLITTAVTLTTQTVLGRSKIIGYAVMRLWTVALESIWPDVVVSATVISGQTVPGATSGTTCCLGTRTNVRAVEQYSCGRW